MRSWRTRLLVATIIVTVSCAGGWIWYSTRDYGAIFLQRKGTYAGQSQTGTQDVTVFNDRGLSADVRLRVPATDAKLPGVLLAVGIETGKRAVDLVPPRDDMVLLAVDYGWEGEFDVRSVASTWRSLRQLKSVTDAAVPRLLLALDYLARQPNVDTNRLVIVGVSFGSYFAIPAAALDRRVTRLILVQGGAEMGPVIEASAPVWKAALPPRALAWVGETLFLPLRPERWIARIAPRRVTFIASRTDPRFPVAAVERVYRLAGEPKELVWHDTPHVAPNAADIIAELSRVVIEQLGAGHG